MPWLFQSSRPGGARRGRAEAGDVQNLALVERLGLQERGGERDQLVAVRGEQAGRFALAFLDDAPHLLVAMTTRTVSHQACGRSRWRPSSERFAGVPPLGALVTGPIVAQRCRCR